MKNFVKLIKQIHEERFSVVVNKLIGQKIPVAFLSIEPLNTAVELVKEFRGQGLNITKLLVVDSNTNADNLDFEVIHVSDAVKIYNQPEYIFVNDLISVRVAMKDFPTAKIISLNKGGTDHIYEAFMTHLPELQAVYESLIDEESKKTFCGYWLGNIANRLADIVYSNSAHYFINGFIPDEGAIVIDGGVFDGGTALVFAEMGYKVYGFELDKINYEMARKFVKKKNFVLENIGLWSQKGKVNYDSKGGSTSQSENGSETAEVTTLDAYVREKNLPRVDFIKLDVEGAELEILKGAVTTIARFKPILALSVYHKWDDFWTIMNFVKSIRPDYEFALRQSFDSIEDAPSTYSEELITLLKKLNLEPHLQWYNECVLFAR